MADIKIVNNISKSLNELSKKLVDMSPVFKALADLELSQTKLRFIDEKDPEGKKWPEPFTLRRDPTGAAARTSFRNRVRRQLQKDYQRKVSNAEAASHIDPWNYVKASNYHAAPPGFRFFDKSVGDKALRDTGLLLKSIGRAYSKNFAVVGTNTEYAKKLNDGRFPFLGLNQKTVENVENVTTQYLKRLGLK